MKSKIPFSNQWTALAIASGLISVLTPLSTTLAAPPNTVRASVSSTGEEGNDNSSPLVSPAISGNGRLAAFASDASNLVPGDNNNVADVFVRDLKTGITQRVSVGTDGTEGNDSSGNFYSLFNNVAISGNGGIVAFSSAASNLVPGDHNKFVDIFTRNLKTGLTQRVTVNSGGMEGNGDSLYPSLSDNGRFIAFSSEASNLVPGDTNNAADVFVRDLKTGVTQRVSVGIGGSEGNDSSGNSSFLSGLHNVAISGNGRFVAFSSAASNLVPGDTNGLEDVFVRDLKAGVTERVSVTSTGEEAASIPGIDPMEYCAGSWFDVYSNSPSISADGRFVAFESDACNLVEGDINTGFYFVGIDYPGTDVFIHDRKTGETKLVSVDSSGEQIGPSYDSSISGNGRFVAFTSQYGGHASPLYSLTTNIVVHDLKTGTTDIVSVVPEDEDDIYYGSFSPSVSATGRFISYASDSSNLVPRDNNNANDVFVTRRW
jgi:hypothetical protein